MRENYNKQLKLFFTLNVFDKEKFANDKIKSINGKIQWLLLWITNKLEVLFKLAASVWAKVERLMNILTQRIVEGMADNSYSSR